MYFEPDENDHGLPYNPLKSCVLPRPIGWITTVGGDGRVNLAPYSFFNMLSYNPPYVNFSAGGRTGGGRLKDSPVNAEETGEFVFNLATWSQREQMNLTASITDQGVDELRSAGLEPLPSRLVKPPRVGGAPVHFECVHHRTVLLPGNTPAADHHLVIGRVIAVHIDDAVIDGDGKLDVLKMRPIARLGYMDYTSVESIFSMAKETPEDRTPAAQAAE